MIVFIIFLVLGILGFFIHLKMDKKPKSPARLAELFLLYQLIFNVGFVCLLSFSALVFQPQEVANYMKWPSCPYEYELGNVNLAFSALGFLSIWYRGDFWRAIIIGMSIWLLADAVGHLLDIRAHGNYESGHKGLLLYTDIFIPLFFITMFVIYKKLEKQERKSFKVISNS